MDNCPAAFRGCGRERTMGRPDKGRDGGAYGFLRAHSLSLTTGAILLAWLVLYAKSDPRTHQGAFFGNAVADWSGSFVIVVITKYFYEVGSAESRTAPSRRRGLRGFLLAHSLSLFLLVTGLGWFALYRSMDSEAKWGQVVGNIASEWVQMLGLVYLTKHLFERGSKESI
jgi:hypothetical protein